MLEETGRVSIGERDPNAYTSDAMHQSLGIKFAPVSKKKVADVQEMVNTIARGIGEVVPPRIIAPTRGVLADPLEDSTRDILGAHLSALYAQRTIDEQKVTQDIPIKERGDRMISLAAECEKFDAHIYITPRVFEKSCGVYAEEKRIHYLRAGVATKIATAFKALNQVNLRGHVYDCYRPEAVQATLFLRRLISIARKEKHWENKEVSQSAKSFTASVPGMAGHQAGAAIDWRLSSTQKSDWKPNLGNKYPECTPASSIDFPYVTYDQWKTRTLFSVTMIMSGMRLLRTEDWHASFGDRGMGLDGGTHEAMYGPIKKFNIESGEIEEFYPEKDVDEPYFSNQEMDDIIAIARSHGGEAQEAIFQMAIQYLQESRDASGADRVRSWMVSA